MKKSTKMKRGDFLMLLVTGVVAGGLFLFTGSSDLLRKMARTDEDPLMAKVKRNGKTVAEIDLKSITETQHINFEDGIKITIESKEGQIRFLSSECPDQICVNAGWLTKEGDIAVCLPAKTVVSI